jgi:hypothetical protein
MNMILAFASSAEVLESRIAPATLTGGVLSYTDVDGDEVKITFSKRLDLDAADFVFDTAFDAAGPQKLLRIDLGDDDARAAGTNITMKVTTAGGDGKADVGEIIASNLDLGTVTILGDLRKIVAGDATEKTPAVKGLTVGSFGLQGAGLSPAPGDQLPVELQSVLNGTFKKIKVLGDFAHASLMVNAFGGKSGSFTVVGKVIGGVGLDEGSVRILSNVASLTLGGIVGGRVPDPELLPPFIFGAGGLVNVSGNVGKATILGDIVGGNIMGTGQLRVSGAVANLKVTGLLLGDEAPDTGFISVTSAGKVDLGGIRAAIAGEGEEPELDAIGNGRFLSSGAVKSITVRDGVIGGDALISGSISVFGALGSLTITGDLVGGDNESTGSVSVDEGIGKLKVTGNLIGGLGETSGVIRANTLKSGLITGDLIGTDEIPEDVDVSFFVSAGLRINEVGSLKIVGSIFGGDGVETSGVLEINKITNLTITGSIEGGAQRRSGWLDLGTIAGSLTIGGNVIGGGEVDSGRIEFETAKKVTIGGNLEGKEGEGSGSIGAEQIGALTIKGSVKSGTGSMSGAVVVFGGGIKTMSVGGDIVGLADHPVIIAVSGGSATSTLGSLKVTGNVEHGRISVGSIGDSPFSPDASIGSVVIGGNFIASSISAGVDPTNGFFADDDDVLIAESNNPDLPSRIASVLIKGSVEGTAGSTTDSFGIVAHEVGKVMIGGAKVALTSGAGNDLTGVLLGTATDVRVREVGS